jgi:P27 family predicted phage terminase small subunit
MTELDEDTLARYLLSKQSYLQYTSLVARAIKNGNYAEVDRVSNLQDKAFKQTRSCAMDLGLTISSRARLVMPPVEPPKENKFVQRFG